MLFVFLAYLSVLVLNVLILLKTTFTDPGIIPCINSQLINNLTDYCIFYSSLNCSLFIDVDFDIEKEKNTF